MAFAHILSSNGATDYGNGKLFLPVCLASSQGVISTTPFPFCSLLPGKFLFIFQYQVKSHPLGNAFHSPQAELLASFTRLFSAPMLSLWQPIMPGLWLFTCKMLSSEHRECLVLSLGPVRIVMQTPKPVIIKSWCILTWSQNSPRNTGKWEYSPSSKNVASTSEFKAYNWALGIY